MESDQHSDICHEGAPAVSAAERPPTLRPSIATSFLSHLVCSACGCQHDADVPQGVCTACKRPLLATYDLDRIRSVATRSRLHACVQSMWRYREFLPVASDADIVTLGEGMTPLLAVPRAGARKGLSALLLKDESQNPTHSFKDRGMSVAVSMARRFGATKLAIPSAGNAASSLAAYAVRAGLEAHVFMPKDSPRANIVASRLTAASVTLVDGLISDCAARISELKSAHGWFDISTLKEPYRVEGKKTLGLELAEQLGWQLPDAIVWPTGGGSGLIGMWKAFHELRSIGWVQDACPKMFCVQVEGCAPIEQAMNRVIAEPNVTPSPGRQFGLRVPKPLGGALILQILAEAGGAAVTVSEVAIQRAMAELARSEGLFVSPECAASYAALDTLTATGAVGSDDKVVIFNTGAGIKYLDWIE